MRPRRQRLPTTTPRAWEKNHAIWLAKSETEKEKFATVSPNGIFSILLNRWTTQGRSLVLRILYAVILVSLHSLTTTRWKHGLSNMLDCSMSSLGGQVMSSQCVCNPDQRTQQDNRRQGCWPICHHSQEAESCRWGRRWAGKSSDRGCFQQQWDSSRLGEEVHHEPL